MQTISPHFPIAACKRILEQATTIAIVGLSPKENRPSNMVARYLISVGYKVIPVNPGQDSILSLPCYPDLASISEHVDIVDIFRRSEDVLAVVEQVVAMNPKPALVWMQQGIINVEAEQLAKDSKIEVVMDRCIKVDHAAFFSEVRKNG